MTRSDCTTATGCEDLLIASTLAADGGLPVIVGRLATVLRRQSRLVRVVGPCPGPLCDAVAASDVAVTALPSGTVWLSTWLSTARAVATCRRLIRTAGMAGRPGCGPIVHIHGVWTPPVVAAACEAARSGVPYVLSPHGMLMGPALRRSPLRKRLAILGIVRKMLERARLVHCSSPAEAEAVLRVAPRAVTLVLPFGVDCQPMHAAITANRPRVAGYVGRLVTIKNLDLLVAAWAAIRPAGWRLRIAGSDGDGTRARLEALRARLGLGDSVSLEGPVAAAEVPAFLSSLAVFVQPSRSENFGLTIVEALAAHTPVITTDGTPWSDIPRHGCGWYVPPTEAGLADAIRKAVACPAADLAAMGRRGAEWVAAEYSWNALAPRYLSDLYGLKPKVGSA